jgi:multidrug efflux system outer membrane protein
LQGLLAAGAVLVLAGCLSNPPYQRPALPLPKNWSAAADTGTVASDDWWDQFHDPRLSQLLAQALANSPEQQVAVDHLLLARDGLRVARSHQYPSLSIGAFPPDPIYTQALAINNGRRLDIDPNLYALSIDATYEVDFWGRVSKSVEAAKRDYQASVFDAGTVAIGLRSEVARAYFDVREQDEEIGLMQQRAALAVERLRLERLRQSAGRIGAAGVIEAQLAEQEARGQVEALQTSRRDSVNALAVLIGVAPESLDLDAAPLSASVAAPSPPQGLPSTLLQRRPDIRAAEAHLAAAHAEIAVARAEMFPQIALSAKFGFVAEAIRGFLVQGSSVVGAGPTIEYSIFDAGRLDAQSDASKRRYDLLLAEYRKSIYSGLADVEKALLGYEQSCHDALRWSDALALQQTQLQHLQQSLSVGFLGRLEVIAAQDRAIDLELASARNYRQTLDSLLALYEALGGGWDPEQLALPKDAPADHQGDLPAAVPVPVPGTGAQP